MSRAKGLDELKGLANPALHYAELVRLAQENSPNKAQQLASGRWPRRQARACRFLAIIRRDFPEAFEAFINPPSEHVQADSSALSKLEEETDGNASKPGRAA